MCSSLNTLNSDQYSLKVGCLLNSSLDNTPPVLFTLQDEIRGPFHCKGKYPYTAVYNHNGSHGSRLYPCIVIAVSMAMGCDVTGLAHWHS